MNGPGVWLRRVAAALLVTVLAAAVLTARIVYDGEREMQSSDAAFDRGDVREATQHARRAAVLYAPGAPHVGAAYDRLVAIAVGAESAGQRRAAVAAWNAVRGAALETRHLWIPRADDLERANRNLARLEAVGVEPAGDAAAAQETLLGLRRDDAPRAVWLVVLVAGFAMAAVGLVLVGLRGVTPEGRIVLGRSKLGLALLLIGAACWTIAVHQA